MNRGGLSPIQPAAFTPSVYQYAAPVPKVDVFSDTGPRRRQATGPHRETPLLETARHIPIDQLGMCDDCGFSPFCDDTTTTRDTAFAKIRARGAGTSLAEDILGGG